MKSKEFILNEDYYLEDGKVVFTAKFLKNRGYCCNNKCRHCPYREDNKTRDKTNNTINRN